MLFGFVLAGTVAGMKRPDAPYTHGVLAGAAVAVVATIIAVAIRLAKGDDVNAGAYAFELVLAAGCGALGAVIAERRGERV